MKPRYLRSSLYSKWVAIGITLLFIGTSGILSGRQPLENTASPASSGTWWYVGGSGPGNYSRIQDAIDNASDGDTVFVYAGIYYENISIHHAITVLGANKDTTIIDGYETDDVVCIVGNGIYFSGFMVQNSSLFGGAGVLVYADEGSVEITNVQVTDNAIGILLKTGTGILLHNTFIHNNTETGVYVQSYRSEILDNTITNNRLFGIVLLDEDVDATVIKHNVITNHQEGIWISDMYPTSHIEITNNIIMNSSTHGVSVGITDSVINGNQFTNNSIAVTLAGGQHNDIRDNTFRNNARGLWIIGAGKNRIHRNNFLHNQEDAFFTYLLFDRNARNLWYRNYWDTHHNPLPKPIKGQKIFFLPYWFNISWVQFDLLPARKPFAIPGLTERK